MGFESSHVLQQLVAGETTRQENQTHVIELLGADVATVSRRLPTSNRTAGWTTARSEASCSANRGSDRYRRAGPGAVSSGDLAYQASKHLHILVSG